MVRADFSPHPKHFSPRARLSSPTAAALAAVWRGSPNASRFDVLLPMDLSMVQLSLFNPGIALTANTSEIYHSGLKLDDPLTNKRTHDYLLLKSPRKVRRRTETIALLVRVPSKFNIWPTETEDYSFDLHTAAQAHPLARRTVAPAASRPRPTMLPRSPRQIVAPPIFTGELVKLDKGPAIVAMQNKHNLRPFMLDVYRAAY